ncbi:MAG: hypothetical protein JW888_16565 [Pirellulales bacterium]|nr:hypothetical protein [Pirellulales bacterium]
MNVVHFVQYLLLRVDLWLAIALIVFLMWLARRSRRWQPRAGRSPSLAARIAETTAIAGIGVALLTLLMTYRCYDGMPYALSDEAPASAGAEYWTVLAIWSAIVAAGLLLSWSGRGGLACAVLTVFFCAAGYAVNDGLVLGYKNHVEAIRATPVPIEITLNDGIRGADVWFNGIYVGKTPIRTTADELFKKVPVLKEQPAEWTDHKKCYYNRHGNGHRPLGWVHLRPPTKVISEDMDPEYHEIFARVELNGQRMYAASGTWSEGGSRMFGQIRPGHVRLAMMLPNWDDETELLIQCARLADYQVDQDWIDAAESYGDRVWEAVRRESEDEPALDRVLDAWATQRYGLAGVRGPDSAWDTFEHIAAEADKQRGYSTDSPPGRAIELILPYLDAERLVDRAAKRITSFRTPPATSAAYGERGGQRFFMTLPPHAWDSLRLVPRDAVLAHAIWKLDERLDQQDNTRDNPIEQRITPALLRLDARPGNLFTMAGILGGREYEQFVLRHNWRAKPSDWSDFENVERVGSAEVNRWRYLAAHLDSPAGRAFRRKNVGPVFEMSEQIVRDSRDFGSSRFPDSLDYLFFDVADGPGSLAERFWPSFDRLATNEPHSLNEAVAIRWNYLVRMQPRCTPERFAEVYRRYGDCRVIQGNSRNSVLARLEPELRFEVLTALVVAAEELPEKNNPGNREFQLRKANADDFVQLRLQVPCEQAADEMLAWLTENSKQHKERMSQAERMSKGDQLSDHHLRRLAKAKDAELRRLAIEPIRLRPTSERRAMLRDLLADKNTDVRAEAVKLNAELEELAARTLPARSDQP